MLRTFRRGAHPNPNKGQTENLPLEIMPTPEKVYISVSQHIGAPAVPVVAEGDKVKAGTLIAQSGGFVSANVYSSVSGTVEGFVSLPGANGLPTKHVVIANDGLYEETGFTALSADATKEEILARIKEAGVVGMGGATFPLHVKLAPKEPLEYLIINGAECEPYITCDYRIMLECSDDFLAGVLLVKKVLGVPVAYVGIEANKPDAIKLLSEKAPEGVQIVPLKAKYPQGAEKQLVYSVTKREVPCGALPSAVGACVCNVQTIYTVARAVLYGEPSMKRAMTVAGDGVGKPGNFWARTGIPYSFVYEYCKGEVDEDVTAKVISGGPMMGMAQATLNANLTKGTSSLLFLSDRQINESPMSACINCASCAKGCPMHLMPMLFESYASLGEYAEVKKLGVANCMECGVCTYNCPAKRPLLQSIRLSKKIIRERGL